MRTPVMRRHRSTAPVQASSARASSAHRGRGPAALVTAAVAALVLWGPGTPAAQAHDELVATVPAADATVPTAPAQVELQMSGTPQAVGTAVLVSGPDGTPVSAGDVELRDTAVVQPLRADLPAGAYSVAWRVTSADGHQLAGSFTFTVADGAAPADTPATDTPAADSPAADSPATDPASAASPPDDEGSALPAVLLGSGGLLAAGAVLGVRQLRRRS
ncbi:copper resistance CopC family protein [Geodermatophilus sp. SYSU D01119]